MEALVGDAMLVVLSVVAFIHLLAFLILLARTGRLAPAARVSLLAACLFVPLAGPVLAVLMAFSSGSGLTHNSVGRG